MVTLRPGTNALFSTNFYHGTWHILSDWHGARLLGRLLWGRAYQGRRTPRAESSRLVRRVVSARALFWMVVMSDGTNPSCRLIEQRLRSRVMEALEVLSMGDIGVRDLGVAEYVEQFLDVIDDDAPWHWREWTCFTSREVRGLAQVQQLLKAAYPATGDSTNVDAFIESGWPARVQPIAAQTLELMRARGRFREDVEEEQPSLPA